MADIEKIAGRMKASPAGVRFGELMRGLRALLRPGPAVGFSHAVFKTPWVGDPRVNIQNDKGKAKAYQVRQVLAAIDKLKGHGDEH